MHLKYIFIRLQVGTENRNEADLKEVRDFMHLIKAPHGKLKQIKYIFLCFEIEAKLIDWFLKIAAKNPELERLHEAASRRLEELKITKQNLIHLKKSKRKDRGKVIITDEQTEENEESIRSTTELVAEEN